MRTYLGALITVCLMACGRIETPSAPKSSQPVTETTPSADKQSEARGKLMAIADLTEALSVTQPMMGDTSDGSFSAGGLFLGYWSMYKLRWQAIQERPTTTWSAVKKDSDLARGMRICTAGSIIEIARDKSTEKSVYIGGMYDGNGQIYRFIAVGSTGNLVDKSRAKFCGIVTGAVSYPNSGGGVTHGVQLVGMFDLPENR